MRTSNDQAAAHIGVGVPEQLLELAIGCCIAVLERNHLLALGQRRQLFERRGAIILVYEVHETAAQEVLVAPPEKLAPARVESDEAIAVGDAREIGRAFKEVGRDFG
ncbi:unannotated protein [freshwater metagenome]|uniref:Unannotated protein n=1 Tax=freshwater metagenome TaxID=449393 RepID=A0A6J7S5R2_9ZZZZ